MEQAMPKPKKNKPNLLFIIGLFVFLALILWSLKSSIMFKQYNLETAVLGYVKHEKEIQVIYANTETVLTAPIEGKIVLLPEDGRKFARGEVILTLIPSGIDHGQNKGDTPVTAPHPGLYYAGRDNLENIVTPENLMNMDLNSLLSQVESAEKPAVVPAEIVSKHSPVGKVVNNLYPSWMFVYLDSQDTMQKEDSFKFIINDNEYSGTVMKVSEQPRGAVIRLNQYVNGSTEDRIDHIIWVVKPPTKGVIVPSKSLCTLGEEIGVYEAMDGLIRFRPVRVLDDNGQSACIEGLAAGKTVVTNPQKI